ncbi:hypothetical protein C2G38_970536 [Gigaspora rosea]|uniref:BTB domain-containing protein n=1 Tax=Gigaspora rosea TaxID=44941 RepID=A0A397W862_9GLOM|nr:hypothetical protein C2G38_970536 [Gigaspora rosea]
MTNFRKILPNFLKVNIIMIQLSKLKLANAIKGNDIFIIKLPNISVKPFNIIIKYIYGGVVSLENLETSDIFDLLITFNEFNFLESIDRFQILLIEDNASWLRLNFARIYQISFQMKISKLCNNFVMKLLLNTQI